MPKVKTNYINTVIYKIVCNDISVTDTYVGHTTCFRQRKNQHKSNCNNANSKMNNFKIYYIIRENGGWDNWNMVEIEKYPCNDGNEARAKERYWYEYLDARLNTTIPNRGFKEYRSMYKEQNVEKIHEQDRQYYERNFERIQLRDKEYRINNKDKVREQRRQKYLRNIEQIKEYQERTKESRKQYDKEYYQRKKNEQLNV